jgi:hypothetical protein
MTPVARRWLAAAVLASGLCASAACAQSAGAADSLLHEYLKSMSDSTNRLYGIATAPVDTSGLDSALTVNLTKSWRDPRARTRPSYLPIYSFNRVDGSLVGAGATLSNRAGRWRLGADAGYAISSHRWLGGGEAALGFRQGDASWSLRTSGYRRTAVMDRDFRENVFATFRALVWGSDRQHYLGRTGMTLALARAGATSRVEASYRLAREHPLDLTTVWNLEHDPLDVPYNLHASEGQVSEVGFDARTHIPHLPLSGQLTYYVSDGALGSDFDYRRARIALGGDLTVARHLSILPQLAYGRQYGTALSQEAFFIGGGSTLRSLPIQSFGGTGTAVARLDLIGADDLLALMHLAHPAFMTIQPAVFGATAAVWGADPFGGPGTPEASWPDANAWRSEAGFSLLYRPGVPEDDAFLRLDYAHPVGNHDGPARWNLSYTRAIDLFRTP